MLAFLTLSIAVLLNASGEIEDSPQASVTGLVKHPDGSSASAAKVYLVQMPEDGFTLPVKYLQSESDSDGRYQFTEVKAGRYMVWAEWQDQTSLKKFLDGTQFEVKKETDSIAKDLQLHQGCSFFIRVIDEETRTPVPDAEVSFGWTDINRKYTTDKRGEATIVGLTSSDWYFVVRSDHYAILDRKVAEPALGSNTELVFEMKPANSVHGVVLDESERPIENVMLSFEYASVAMRPSLGVVTTDMDGRFAIKSLPRGEDLVINFMHEDFHSGNEKIRTQDEASSMDLQLHMKEVARGPDCVVIVKDEKGRPIADATVSNHGVGKQYRIATTDDKGYAKLDSPYLQSQQGMKGSFISVYVKAKGFMPQWISVRSNQRGSLIRQEVQLTKGRTIQGQVINSKKEPIPNVNVSYVGDEILQDTTDLNGRFRLDNLPEGAMISFLPHPPYACKRDEKFNGGDREIKVVLAYEGVVRIRAVAKGTQKSIPEFKVRLFKSAQRQRKDPAFEIDPNDSDVGSDVISPTTEFRKAGFAVGSPVKVVVTASGYAPVTIERLDAALEEGSEATVVELEQVSPIP